MKERLDALTLPLWGSRLIEASAGTGKTWTIAALYLRFVLGHGEEAAFGPPLVPPQILVMTFTRAATRELSDRIRTRLVDAARSFRGSRPVDPGDALLHGLIAAFPEGAAREQAAWRLATAADGMDDAAVFTIDAWVQRMLREHAFDSGCLFDEEVQADETAMRGEAARDYWRQQVYPLDTGTLDRVLAVWPTVEALARDVGKLMPYVDDDGSAARSLAEVWADASAERSAALAPVKAPWPERVREMRGWIRAQLASPARPFNGHRLQHDRVDGWLDSVERWAHDPEMAAPALAGKGQTRLSPDGLRDALRPGQTLEIPPLFDAWPSLTASQQGVPDPAHAARRHAAARVAARMAVLKQRAGTYGFADMLERLDRALHGPSGERLRARIVAQYPVVLIDEFQDTSALQYRIFDTLYRPAANDRDSALLLIGDPKQSIFGFRGADIRSYLRARAAMADRHYFLTTNYRATVDLVGAINHLFGRAEHYADGAFRFGAGADSALPFVPVDAQGRREVFTGAGGPVAALTICHDAQLSTRHDAQRRFAERCAEHIVASLDDPQAGFVDPVDGFTRLCAADITILVRDKDEAMAMRRALRARRVQSAYLSDQESVFRTPEAADLLHWLHAVADPLDSRRARVAFATALVGLPLEQMARLASDDVAFERRLDDLRTLNVEWRRQGVLPMLRRTLHLLDLPARWLARADGERTLTNVLHLAELLQEASAKLDGEQALIRWFAAQLARDDRGGDEQIVRLESDAALIEVVTIWKAKGLEYPVVYVPFVCGHHVKQWKRGAFAVLPDADCELAVVFDPDDADRARVVREAEQEDLRLLYVALTRARHALWLGVAPLRAGASPLCRFQHSAFGYLVAAGTPVAEHEIAARLHEAFDGVPSVVLDASDGPVAHTRLAPPGAVAELVDAPDYAAVFERDWTVGSFSAFVRDLARAPVARATRAALDAVMLDPAVEEELLTTAADDGVAAPDSSAPRHRFPRGAVPGNFLHDQLEWLAAQRFALGTDATVGEQLAHRCERLGWGHRAADVASWLGEVVDTLLPPIGVALSGLGRILPEMEFWFPSHGVDARHVDALCRHHLLDGRDRPSLPDRMLRGMLMGFADLVFEVDGRYWVLDYKSNALGAGDSAYTHVALEASMAEHRYDVQAALYLLALHRLLRARLGARYDPARQLGGALYLFLRGIRGPVAGCYTVAPDVGLLDAFDAALAAEVIER